MNRLKIHRNSPKLKETHQNKKKVYHKPNIFRKSQKNIPSHTQTQKKTNLKMQKNEETISDLFNQGYELFESFDKRDDPSNSLEFQVSHQRLNARRYHEREKNA